MIAKRPIPRRGQLMIREATPADVDDVVTLVPQLVAFGPPPWRDGAQMTRTDVGIIREAVLSNDQQAVVFVATIAGRIVGFVHARAVVEYYSQQWQGHVADLVVGEQARGLGVGSRLLDAAEFWARARGFLYLTIAVFERNERALRLYERQGFEREVIRLIKPLTEKSER